MDAHTDIKPRSRLLTSMVSAGSIGKTTMFTEIVTPYLKYVQIPFQMIDADDEHRTLSQFRPDAAFLPATTQEEFRMILQNLAQRPVEMVDFPAQHTTKYLNWLNHYLPILDAKGIRITIFLFAAARLPSAIQSTTYLLNTLGTRVDYVIVDSPGIFKSAGFYETPLGKRLIEINAPTIIIPPIMRTTLDARRSISAQAGKWLSLWDAKYFADEFTRMDIEFFEMKSAAACEDIAHLLVPDSSQIKKSVIRFPEIKLDPIKDLTF
jgi:hypothetical protein